MEDPLLKRRMNILKALHACFVLTLLLLGLVGVCFFGYIVHQPMRTCPFIYAVYTTFWLSLGLSLVKVFLAFLFLAWFVLSIWYFSTPDPPVTGGFPTSDNRITPTPRPVIEALGHPRTRTNPYPDTTSVLSGRVRTTDSSKTIRVSARCRPKCGWLCLGGIFLAFLSAGLTVTLVLSVCHLSYLYTRFSDDWVSSFIEARVNFREISVSQTHTLNNALICWNRLQEDLGCCGLHSYADWSNHSRSPQPEDIPTSCNCYFSCGYPHGNVSPIMVGGRLVYAAGCYGPVKSALLFNMLFTEFYLAISLGLLMTTFFADLIYTLYTAYVTLRRSSILTYEQRDIMPATTMNDMDVEAHSSPVSVGYMQGAQYQI